MALSKLKEVGNYLVEFATVIIATMGIIADGMQFAWPSPAVPKLLSEDSPIEMTKAQSKWVSQLFIIGNIAGVLLSFLLFRKLSRKLSVYMSCIPITLAWIGIISAKSIPVLFVARFIGGIGRNMAFVSVPMYIGEIANPKIRGVLGNCVYTMMNIGVVIVYSVTPYNQLYVSAIIGLAFAMLQLVLLLFVPESPYYLLTKGKTDKAKKVLQHLRRRDDVEEELRAIAAAVERQTAQKSNFTELFTVKSNRRALGILLTLRAVQTLSGVSVMTMHIHTILRQATESISPEISAIAYSSMMLLSCLLTFGLADRYGRKPLMIVSCILTAIILLLQGTYFYLKICTTVDTDLFNWLPILNTAGFVFFYRIGLGTIPIIMVSEIFSANVKVSGVVLSDLIYSIASLTSNTIYSYTEDSIGMFAPFWIYALVCVSAAVFSILVVPETKGKTLEEIQLLLMQKSPPKIKENLKVNESDAL